MKNIRRKVTLSILLLILLFSIDGMNSAKEVAGRYRKTMRSTSHGINEPPYRFERLHAVRLYEIHDTEELKGWIDKAALIEDGVLIFYTHCVTEGPGKCDVSPGKFEEILDYAVNSGVPILTIDEAFKVNGTPRIVFTFDDGTITDYTTAYQR